MTVGYDVRNNRVGDISHTIQSGDAPNDTPIVFQATGAGAERAGSPSLSAGDDNGSNHVVTHALTRRCPSGEDGTGRGTPLVVQQNGSDVQTGAVPGSLLASQARQTSGDLVAFTVNAHDSNATQNHAREADTARCLDGTGGYAPGQGGTLVGALGNGKAGGGWRCGPDEAAAGQAVVSGMVVRRLTPVECCRLQGFDDHWLDLDPPLSDSAKYRLLGNAVCRKVARWLGRRIALALKEGTSA